MNCRVPSLSAAVDTPVAPGRSLAVMPDRSVEEMLEEVVPARRRRDARTMPDLMTRATGEQPTLSGSIVGFGTYHYRYESAVRGTPSPRRSLPASRRWPST